MCFSYPDEDQENGYMWCCGIVTRVKRRDKKMIILEIKWEESFVSFGESEQLEEILKKTLVESGDRKGETDGYIGWGRIYE